MSAAHAKLSSRQCRHEMSTEPTNRFPSTRTDAPLLPDGAPGFKSRRRNPLLVIALAWAVCIVGASLFANDAKDRFGTGVPTMIWDGMSVWPLVPLRHRIMHFFAFGALALLLVIATGKTKSRLLVTAAVVAFGFGIEYAQYRIFAGVFEWWDLRDDTLGAIAGFVIGSWRLLRRRNVRRPSLPQ